MAGGRPPAGPPLGPVGRAVGHRARGGRRLRRPALAEGGAAHQRRPGTSTWWPGCRTGCATPAWPPCTDRSGCSAARRTVASCGRSSGGPPGDRSGDSGRPAARPARSLRPWSRSGTGCWSWAGDPRRTARPTGCGGSAPRPAAGRRAGRLPYPVADAPAVTSAARRTCSAGRRRPSPPGSRASVLVALSRAGPAASALEPDQLVELGHPGPRGHRDGLPVRLPPGTSIRSSASQHQPRISAE